MKKKILKKRKIHRQPLRVNNVSLMKLQVVDRIMDKVVYIAAIICVGAVITTILHR